MTTNNPAIASETQKSNKEQVSPPQSSSRPTDTSSSLQPPYNNPQPSHPPAHQASPQPLQGDKSSRAGIIGATTGGLTAHLSGGGILSTIVGAMAGAASAKKISEIKKEKEQREGENNLHSV
uniref:Uncharacterized protein n=1 Tax=Colletotrichum fructicola (strain Nara gc5) TaxID=1213859 RepID=L2FET9_COLFN